MLLCACTKNVTAQSNVIRLYPGKAPGSEHWLQQEKIFHDPASGESFAYNVTDPTLTVFMADRTKATGTGVIVCPGGAFHVLSLDNEGIEVAKWLNSIGITAFVLKYRLAESKTSEPLKEFDEKIKDIKNWTKKMRR